MEDLRGKTVGANGPFDASHLAIRVALARLGGTPTTTWSIRFSAASAS